MNSTDVLSLLFCAAYLALIVFSPIWLEWANRLYSFIVTDTAKHEIAKRGRA